ncbi:hypothetical protein PENTCL1PPCAC_28457, partial [Pristionchus entomophagus]
WESCEKIEKKMLRLNRKKSSEEDNMIKDEYPGLDFLGLQDVLSSKTKWYKALWLLVLLINCMLGAICTSQIISEYMAHPTATLISYKSVDQLLLPQVTVCGTAADHVDFSRFYAFAHPQLAEADNNTLTQLLVYILAGSGFQKFETVVGKWNATYMLDTLKPMYETLRGNMSTKEFFHVGQNLYGFQCSDLFQQCKLGEETLDCCKVFQPTYTIRRGRCFRSVRLHQSSYDEIGKLGLRFKEPIKLFPSWSAEELLIFLNEYKTDIGPFPRLYMYSNDYNKFRVSSTEMKLIQRNGVCANENSDKGRSTCYIEKWIEQHLEGKLNCTYPYMDMLRATTFPPCEPHVILRNYSASVQSEGYDAHDCTLACNRTEYNIQIERTKSNFANQPYKYRADINYNDLQYQLIEEVTTISFLGLVAQLGGQLGLFLGSSIIDLIQLALILSIIVGRYARSAVNAAPPSKPNPTIHVMPT